MLALLVSLTNAAHAAPALPDYIEAGAVVRITGVGPADAFYRNRKELKGFYCGVEEGGMTREKGKFYSGSITCGEAGNYYFYNVAVEVGDWGIDYSVLTGHAVGEPMPGSDTSSYSAAASPWTVGTRVVITGISSADAHVGDAPRLVGRTCTVAGDPLSSTGDVWFSGQLNCDGGEERYFYQVSVAAAGAATPAPATVPVGVVGTPAPATTTGAAAPSPFGAGKMVKVVDVGTSDALYATRATIVGHTCTILENPLLAMPEGWYAGRLFCDDGKSYQLLQVKVAAP